jgi:hypothetical protein
MGFRGFIRVRELLALPPRQWHVPNDAVGVYVAYRVSGEPPSFLRTSPAGQWRGDPTLPLADLRARWVAGSHVVYIGQASRPTASSKNSLRSRVRTYVRFGAGHEARHYGGYPTWQLRDAPDLLIGWLIVKPPATPASVERRLLNDHVAVYRRLPFANSI